jgi:hypothetical protein
VDFEDGFAAIDVRGVDDNLAIEAAGPEQGPIEDVGPVGRGENDDAGIGGEAVHFNEELVDGLLAFVIDSPDVNAALTSNGVEFVDEDDAWGFCFGLLKQVANAGCADADEHFDKITAADGEERGMGFSRDRFREQGLASAGRADEQNAFRDACANGFIAVRVLEKIDDFGQFLFGFFAAGHVLEGDAGFLFGDEAGAAFAEA